MPSAQRFSLRQKGLRGRGRFECAVPDAMPERLTIKRPKPINTVAAWILAVPLAFVTMWYFRLFEKEENIHFEDRWLNLAVHSALILVPMLISVAISLQRT